MCGINGFNWNNEILINKMNKKIIHRGPDYQDIKLFKKISLGHTRLKIIDLSSNANQPMSNENENLSIVFNGEIYNYKELKKKYCKNYNFKSVSDTEVILAMYEQFGDKCVNYFNGMWAFCIYDKSKEILFCSRDRLGIKPFHYYYKDSKFIFSSEIKSILLHEIEIKINSSAISSFLRYRYVLEEGTFFENINKLKPGYNLIYDLRKKSIQLNQYWDVNQHEIIDSFNSQKEIIEKELLKSTQYRMVADVEVGSILSGGLDSSLLSAIMAKLCLKKINTYTVKFGEEGFDETYFAKLVADKYQTEHHELEIKDDAYLASMKEYLKYKDEPIGVPNEVALYLLFKKIKKTATVVLAGEGADEIFAGYGRIFRSPFDYFKKTISDNEINFLDFFMDNYGYFSDNDISQLLQKKYNINFKDCFADYFRKCPRDNYNKISYLFLKIHLPGLLLRSDVSSMANAIESRVPFLDHNFVQSAYSLPIEYKNKFKSLKALFDSIDLDFDDISENKDIPKYILKKIAKNYIPDKIINRKKMGFPLPFDKWFGEDFVDKIRLKLLDKSNFIANYFNLDELGKWIEENSNENMFSQKLWMIYSLEIWLESINDLYSSCIWK